MKTLMLVAVVVWVGVQGVRAAEKPLPEQALALHATLAPKLQPAVREWVSKEAKKISKDAQASEAAIKADIQKRFADQQLAPADLEALVFVVLMEATQDARADLKASMETVREISSRKSAQRQAAGNLSKEDAALQGAGQMNVHPAATNHAPAKPDAAALITDQDRLQLQQAMDRRAQCETMLSNMMKTLSDTQKSLLGNLK